jgi:ribose 5-phosphate isomerase B
MGLGGRSGRLLGMRVHLASDHAGFELKAAVAARLQELGHEPVDHGPVEFDAEDDYPPFVLAAARAVVDDPGSLGVVLGGSGNGEAIAANKVDGVRAALAWSDDTARLGREHNDANVLALGARQYATADALRFVEVFVGTPFSNEARHRRRIAMLTDYERSGEVPSP